MTPLHRSVVLGYPLIVDIMLAGGADADTRNTRGMSAMDSALRQGYVRTARVLRRAGAGLDTRKDLVTFVQNQLWFRGYGIDQVDGLAGANTAAAIRAYQGHAGMPRDGLVSRELADHLAESGEIAPYLTGENPTLTNIFVSWHPLAHEHDWDPRLLWSRGEILDDGTRVVDAGFRGAVRYTGRVRFAHLEVAGTAWVLGDGWVIAHGSKVSLKDPVTPPAGY
jgi:peptidoglycan hydrolase-like protein with peptidoglycan-binding domain